MNRTISETDLKTLLDARTEVEIVDVRRRNDYDADTVKLPGACWRDPERLAEWSGQLPLDRHVVLYCVRGGAVSNAVVDALRAKGIKARFIEGGIEAWKRAGRETVGKDQ